MLLLRLLLESWLRRRRGDECHGWRWLGHVLGASAQESHRHEHNGDDAEGGRDSQRDEEIETTLLGLQRFLLHFVI